MKNCVLLFIFCFQFLYAQTPYDKVILLDSLKRPANTDDYFFKKVIKDYNSELAAYKFLLYSKEDKLIEEGYYSDLEIKKPEGELISYYENGLKKKS